MLSFQMRTLVEAWRWGAEDHVLHVLPCHHIHGVVNVLLCALYAGAKCTFLPPPPLPPAAVAGAKPSSSAEQIARALMDDSLGLSVFMAVPTIYSQVLAWVAGQAPEVRVEFRNRVSSRFRLMVSGSSALPLPVLEGWLDAAGIDLLERYGMSETGMTLSQPYNPPSPSPSPSPSPQTRRNLYRGSVGSPLPGVLTKIVPLTASTAAEDDASTAASVSAATAATAAASSSSSSSSPSSEEEVGELRVKGSGVFSEYWNRPDKTREEFDEQGWFKTGDVVAVTRGAAPPPTPASPASGAAVAPAQTQAQAQDIYRMLGRASVDVLKSGGYKISALDVERELLAHPDIEACAVVGVPDEQYGQIVGAIVQLKQPSGPAGATCSSAASLQTWCRSRLAAYQVPRLWRIVAAIPRNAMGKTNKKELVKLFAAADATAPKP